jgi:hypothetical protein
MTQKLTLPRSGSRRWPSIVARVFSIAPTASAFYLHAFGMVFGRHAHGGRSLKRLNLA